MSNFALAADDYFDADFFDQFDRRNGVHESASDFMQDDDATAILAPTAFAARLVMAFSNIMLLVIIFTLAMFLVLGAYAFITLNAGSGFLPGIR